MFSFTISFQVKVVFVIEARCHHTERLGVFLRRFPFDQFPQGEVKPFRHKNKRPIGIHLEPGTTSHTHTQDPSVVLGYKTIQYNPRTKPQHLGCDITNIWIQGQRTHLLPPRLPPALCLPTDPLPLLPDMSKTNPWHRPTAIVITGIGIAAIVALVTIGVLQNKPITQKYKYGIVIDAGSSHTSLFIYQWPAEKDNNTGRVEQTHSCDVEGPGISSYASHPQGAAESLRECMQEAEKWIPASRHGETPLYLGATAGMRLLNIENSTLADDVLQAVEQTLQKSPFAYQGARILAGREEGAFGWVTVNYMDDRLTQGLETNGALDLGGASTQISFVSDKFDGSESPGDSVSFRLYGNDYNVYTHSFLCYGQDQALRMVTAQLSQVAPATVENPCLHVGFNETLEYSELYSSPCVSHLKPKNTPATFVQKGTGNYTQCYAIIRSVFNYTGCTHSQCSFNGVFQPAVQGQFWAFSGYFYTMSTLAMTDTSLPLKYVKDYIARHCSTPWDQVVLRYPGLSSKYLFKYCFNAVYILNLLLEGYKFDSETYPNIQYTKKIKGSDVGWTLGYMLNLTNRIPAEAPDKPPLPYAGYVSVVTILGIVLFILFILSMRPLWPRCSKQTNVV